MTEEFGAINGRRGRLAYRYVAGAGPTIIWLGGFRSDMSGAKAQSIANWAMSRKRDFLRFDYSGHGESEGDFAAGTISAWLSDAQLIISRLTEGPLILVGSSMGGWLSALIGREIAQRLFAAVFIAPALDFTEDLIWAKLTREERDNLLKDGRLIRQKEHSEEPSIITHALIEDGRNHLLLRSVIDIRCKVRILQGMADEEVPWTHALRLAERLVSKDVDLMLIKRGDHRLSRPDEIEKIISTINSIAI